MNISIKFNEDLRNVFKKDDEIAFDFTEHNVILVTGPNGSGKSTLVNSMRAHQCSNEDRQEQLLGTANLNYSTIKSELKPFTEVNTDFKNIYYLSSEFDDPLSMYTTFDATSFIENGGWATSHVSKGQRLMYQFVQYMKKYGEKMEDSLLVFDEVDTGYDLKNQITFYKLLPIMCMKRNCRALVITHCAIPFIYCDFPVYDLKERKFVENGKKYLDDIVNGVIFGE